MILMGPLGLLPFKIILCLKDKFFFSGWIFRKPPRFSLEPNDGFEKSTIR